MKVVVSSVILSNSLLLSLVAAANGVIEAEIGPTDGVINVAWSVASSASGPPRLRVEITDSGRCDETFELSGPDEFDSMRTRLRECGRRLRG